MGWAGGRDARVANTNKDGTGGGAGAVKRHDCVGRGLWGMCGGLHGVPRGTVVGAEVHVVCGVNSANPL